MNQLDQHRLENRRAHRIIRNLLMVERRVFDLVDDLQNAIADEKHQVNWYGTTAQLTMLQHDMAMMLDLCKNTIAEVRHEPT